MAGPLVKRVLLSMNKNDHCSNANLIVTKVCSVKMIGSLTSIVCIIGFEYLPVLVSVFNVQDIRVFGATLNFHRF